MGNEVGASCSTGNWLHERAQHPSRSACGYLLTRHDDVANGLLSSLHGWCAEDWEAQET